MNSPGDSPAASQPSARYGLACEQCVKAKAKCLRATEDTSSCERCRRIGKDCTPSIKRRRLNDGPKRVRMSKGSVDDLRTSRVEEKLNQLVNLLAPSTARPQARTSLTEGDIDGVPRPLDTSGYRTPCDALTFQEEMICLETFRTCHLTFFPFISLPPTTTVANLRQQYPHLWSTIVGITTKSTTLQQAQSDYLRRTFSEQILFQTRPSIDILLALLAFVGWLQFQVNPHFHTQKENFKGSIVAFVQLAIGVVYELKLHKAVTMDPLHIRCVPAPSDDNRKALHTLVERRALLGCVLLTSSISCTIKTVEPLRWTSHMDECILELQRQRADPLDELLVHLVKIQRVVDRASDAESFDVHSPPSTSYDIRSTLYPQALLMHLDSIAEQIPANVRDMPILNFQLSSARLVLAEIALAGDPTVTTTTSAPNLQRLRYLELALQSIKSWINFYTTMHCTVMRYVSMPIMLQFRFCAGMLFVLTTLNEPAWLSREEVRAEVDLLAAMDHASRMYGEVAAAVGLDNGPSDVKGLDLFTLASGRGAKLRAMWATQLEIPADRLQHVQMRSDELETGPALPTPGSGEFSEVYAGMEELNWKEVDWFIDSLFVL